MNSAAYTEGVRSVIDNLLIEVTKITKKNESEMKLISNCPKWGIKIDNKVGQKSKKIGLTLISTFYLS